MKQLKTIFCLLFVIGAGHIQAQQKYELTVKDAVDLAFKNVTDLKNAQLDYRLQEAKNKEIRGQAYPQITAAVSGSHYLQLPNILFPDATQTIIYNTLISEGLLPSTTKIPNPVLQAVSFQQPWNLSIGGTLTQLLFQPDVFVALQARQTSLDYYRSLTEQSKKTIRDSAYKRYYAILIAQKQLYFLDEGVKRLEKLYHDDSLMYKNGFAEHLDLDKVQVQLNNLKTNQSVIQNAVDLSYAALKFAMGISQKDTVVLKNDLTVANIKEDVLDDNFKYEDRPEIRTLGYTKRLQELDLKRNRMGYFPTVSLSGNYSVNALGQHFFTDPSTVWLKSSYIGLNINVPIFDGFQRKYKIQESLITLEKLENSISGVKQVIDLEQVVTKASLTNALLSLDVQERNQQLAERVYNATKLKFEQGLGSSFEVLQSDTDWQTAQSNYFNALYNAIIAKISYQSALGKL